MKPSISVFTINGSSSDAVLALCIYLGINATFLEKKHHNSKLTEINPDRTVPTVIMENGLVLTETIAILNHISRIYAIELLGNTMIEKAKNEEVLSFVATSVYNAFLLYFRPDRSANSQEAHDAIRATSNQAINKALDTIQNRIMANPFALGEHLLTCDFFLMVMLRWADRVDPVLLKNRQKLQNYYINLKKILP